MSTSRSASLPYKGLPASWAWMGVRRRPRARMVDTTATTGAESPDKCVALYAALKAPLFHVSTRVRGLPQQLKPASRHSQLPQQITAGLPHDCVGALYDAVWTRIWPGCDVDPTDTRVFEQSPDASDVIG